MQKKLNQNFSCKFQGTIWNMLFDDEESLLILEVRDVAGHKTSFAAIDLVEKHLLWDNLGFDEVWWIGMSLVHRGSILFHTYENDENPVPGSHFLYSVKKQKVLWTSSDYHFFALADSGILGYLESGDKSKALLLNPVSGSIQKIDGEYEENADKIKGSFHLENKKSSIPFHYPEETDYFNLIKKYLAEFHNINPVKAFDYLETENSIIISYYLCHDFSKKGNGKFDNYLLVLNKNGKQLLLERIDENLPGIGLGTFFVAKNQLIFSREKSEIISYQLDDE